MARLFDDAQSEYLIRADTCGLSDFPFTFACWFNSDDTNKDQRLIEIADTVGGDHGHMLSLRNDPDNDVSIVSVGGGDGFGFAATSTTYAASTWSHACAVFAADQDRRVYLNGGGKGTNVADNVTYGAGLDNLTIGGESRNGSIGVFMDGPIGVAAIWSATLTDAEVLILQKYSPEFVRPQNLVAYWRLIRGLNDRAGGYTLTAVSGNSGPIVSPHPPIIYPAAPMIVMAPAVGAVKELLIGAGGMDGGYLGGSLNPMTG